MKKYLFVSVMVIILVGLIFSGCAAPATPAPTASASSPAPAKTSSPAATPAAVIKLSVASGEPPDSPYFLSMKLGTEWVKDKSQGRVQFTYYPAGALLAHPEAYDGTVKDTADIAQLVVAYLAGRFPLTEVLDLGPALALSELESPIYQTIFNKYLAAEWSQVKILTIYAAGPVDVHANKVIKTASDMKGLRLRTFGYAAKVVQALGGVPVNMAASETYDALVKGLVDGSTHTPLGQESLKTGEVTKYSTALGITSTPFAVMMNKDKYNSLPPDIKSLFDQLSEWLPAATGKIVDDADNKGYDFMKSKGGQVYIPTTAEKAAILKDVEAQLNKAWLDDKEAKGIRVTDMLNERNKLLTPYFPEAFK